MLEVCRDGPLLGTAMIQVTVPANELQVLKERAAAPSATTFVHLFNVLRCDVHNGFVLSEGWDH